MIVPASLTALLILGTSTILLLQTGWFLCSVIWKRNDIADIAWGLHIALLSILGFFIYENHRGLLVALLVTVWGLRLSWHIARRVWNRPEDERYATWRRDWGKKVYLRSYLQVFVLQGLLGIIVALPALLATSIPAAWSPFDVLGTIVWTAGFFFEAIADRQLRHFKSNPVNLGKLLRTGLWAWSRHPNYFGEVLQWWGIALIALSVPSGYVGIIGAVTITVLIVKVSGIPLLEAKMRSHPDFADYARTTNAFIPWPPTSPII